MIATSTTDERFEASQRMNQKRMTKAELARLAEMVRRATKSLDEAVRYESTSAKHPVALKHEEIAEAQLDAAILYLAEIRSRVTPGPVMRADGTIR
jgi:hypothetical protein